MTIHQLKSIETHNKQLDIAQNAMRDLFAKKEVVGLKRSDAKTHCTRKQSYKKNAKLVDLSPLEGIIEIDTEKKVAIVEPFCTMEKLIDATLPLSLKPFVVPEFKGITVGGAISGGGLESTSHHYGLFENKVLWFDILLGNGDVVRASPEQNSDLFYGAMWSMGSLGYVVLIGISLTEAKPYVHLHYETITDRKAALARIGELCHSSVEFFECIIYNPNRYVMIYGELADTNMAKELPTFSLKHYWSQWFYKHVEETSHKEELIPLKDYLFRHDRGVYWLAESKMKPTFINRLLFGWLFTMERHHALSRLKKDTHNESKRFLADLGPPLDKLDIVLDEVDEKLYIYPLWILPFRIIPQNQKIFSPDRVCQETDMVVDLGIYGIPGKQPFLADEMNRHFEYFIHSDKVRGMKGFETVCYYKREDFWQFFDAEAYNSIRKKYYAEGVFVNIFDKITVKT